METNEQETYKPDPNTGALPITAPLSHEEALAILKRSSDALWESICKGRGCEICGCKVTALPCPIYTILHAYKNAIWDIEQEIKYEQTKIQKG